MTEEAERPSRALLPFTYTSWFGHFPDFTEVQKRAIPPVLAGRDVLICSATASGKTEAYAAPAAEIAIAHGRPPGTVLIVSPTRALANDLKRRLEGPMDRLQLTFGRYTGEHKELVKKALPTVAVTTPESLDSILVRRPGLLVNLRLIVIDEIHVLDNSPRGDQLRCVLHRLENLLPRRPQRVAASATVEHPAEVAGRYLRDAELVVVPGGRRLLLKAFEGKTVPDFARHLDELSRAGFKKILVFCRSRNEVESLASKLKPHPDNPRPTRFEDRVFAHHGSMSQMRREQTEHGFLNAPFAVCFATLTLEMGIDIGSVDYVLLNGAPSDVSSLMQRIGRGGRRGDATRAGFAVGDEAELFVLETMFRMGKEGRLCDRPYGFRPAVLAQQACVIAGAEGFLEISELEAAIPPAVQAFFGESLVRDVLDGLVEAEHMERRGRDRYVLTAEIEENYMRGRIHGNIDGDRGLDVVDRMTGDVIGIVDEPESNRIEIGGASRLIVKKDDERILTDATPTAKAAYFRPRGSPSVSLALARAVVEGLGTPKGRIGVVEYAGRVYLLHGLGTVGALLLDDLLASRGGTKSEEKLSPFVRECSERPVALPRPDEERIERFVTENLHKLEGTTSPGPWAKSIPEPLRLQATRAILGIDEVVAYFGDASSDDVAAAAGLGTADSSFLSLREFPEERMRILPLL